MIAVEDPKTPDAPDVETIKQLLRSDTDILLRIGDTPKRITETDVNGSSFCEHDIHLDAKIRVIKTYSRTPTPHKGILQSIGNTRADECRTPKTPKRALKSNDSLYDWTVLDSLVKRKRKKLENQDENENISKITEQFATIEKYQLAIE